MSQPLKQLTLALAGLVTTTAVLAAQPGPAVNVPQTNTNTNTAGARTSGASSPIPPKIPTPAGVQLTDLAYDYPTGTETSGNIHLKISGNAVVGSLNNCVVTLKIGTLVDSTETISTLPKFWFTVAPKDGESISFKSISAGCAGQKSVIYKKPFVADPNFVGTFTGISMGKVLYKDNEDTSFTVTGNNGEATCSAKLTVDGNYTMPIFINPFLPALKFPQTRSDLGKYKAGWHKVKVEGGPSNGMLPCKGSATVDFNVVSTDPNAPTLTSVQPQFQAPLSGFKAGFAQPLLINGTGLCAYSLIYKGVGPQSGYIWISPIQSAKALPHTSNINPIATPGDYTVQAKPEGDCSGGPGAAFNVSLP
jgi:hypothetical protein